MVAGEAPLVFPLEDIPGESFLQLWKGGAAGDPPALTLRSPLPLGTGPLGVPLRPRAGGSALAHRMIQDRATIRSVVLRGWKPGPRHQQHLGAW